LSGGASLALASVDDRTVLEPYTVDEAADPGTDMALEADVTAANLEGGGTRVTPMAVRMSDRGSRTSARLNTLVGGNDV
jgi:hypothetical protein